MDDDSRWRCKIMNGVVYDDVVANDDSYDDGHDSDDGNYDCDGGDDGHNDRMVMVWSDALLVVRMRMVATKPTMSMDGFWRRSIPRPLI